MLLVYGGDFSRHSLACVRRSGYAEGDASDANYEAVSGMTQHREAIEVVYDPAIISYATLVNLSYTQIDPTQVDGQFADRGFRYTTAIYYQDDAEREIMETARKEAGTASSDKPIAVQTVSFTTFFSKSTTRTTIRNQHSDTLSTKNEVDAKDISRKHGEKNSKNSPKRISKTDSPQSSTKSHKKKEPSNHSPMSTTITRDQVSMWISWNWVSHSIRLSISMTLEQILQSFTKPIDPNAVRFEEQTFLDSYRSEVQECRLSSRTCIR